MATPPKRRKQYMRPDRVILGYSDNSDSSEADYQQRVNVDSDSGDGFSDNFDANEGDDREASVDREIGDASSDGECASENRIDETENSADAEDLDEEVLRPESLEDFLASEHSDDDEVGAGSIEDFLTLISEEYGASTLPHSPTTKAGAIAMIMSYAVSERMTWTGLGKQLKLFTVNELPPSVRLHHSTLAGLWFGKCHPDMSAFMEKFVDEVNNMTPVTWMHGDHRHTSKAFVLCCSVDAPARAAVQNMVLFNGFFGCPWCLMKGEHEEGCVRYVLMKHLLQGHRSLSPETWCLP
ncbi:hypothetical protein HPB47_026633 [Ixodes persulcatus]|uniref:Uncharacterized protein n=1 Tax=Ixodes persulcatus TaxID=34615 RepID=A0AC60PY51_IXOPE|nr:hypothetical protein HPB47_026633 [Ixodes persulcatus]